MRYAVYEYGCLDPLAGEEPALEQMRRRVDFWNALVTLEQEHIARTREVLRVADIHDRIAQLRAEIPELRSQIKAGREATPRMPRSALRDLRAHLALLRTSLQTAIAEAKQLQPQIVQQRRDELARIDAQRKEAAKQLRRQAALYWCNADEILALYEQARIDAMKQGSSISARAWRGSGTVSVKYQRGLSPSALSSDTRFQIDDVDPAAWSDPRRSVRRRLARTVARIRVGSTDKRQPVWLELPIVLHRPLPADALIRSVRVKRYRLGTQFRYKLFVTIRHDDGAVGRDGDAPVRGLGIVLDCRETTGDVRVGCWTDTDGAHGELTLPAAVVSQFERLNELRSMLDRNWNEARTQLLDWQGAATIPAWMHDALRDLPLWTDQYRPLTLFRTWAKNRFEGDEWMFGRLADWRGKHDHLRTWASHLRDQVQKRRRELYRILAVQIARKYNRVYITAPERRGPRKERQAPVLSATERERREAHTRAIAAPSILRRILMQTAERERVFVQQVPKTAAGATCPVCGTDHSTSSLEHGTITCRSCSAQWDRGHGSALAILRFGLSHLL